MLLPSKWVKKLHFRGKADLVACSEEVLGCFFVVLGGSTPDPPHWSLFSATALRRSEEHAFIYTYFYTVSRTRW